LSHSEICGTFCPSDLGSRENTAKSVRYIRNISQNITPSRQKLCSLQIKTFKLLELLSETKETKELECHGFAKPFWDEFPNKHNK